MIASFLGFIYERRETARYNLIWFGFLEAWFIVLVIRRGLRNDSPLFLFGLLLAVIWTVELLNSTHRWWEERERDITREQAELDLFISRSTQWRDTFMRSARKIRDDPVAVTDGGTGVNLKPIMVKASVSQARSLNWQIVEARRERGDYKRKGDRWSFVPQTIRRTGRS